MDPPPHRTVVFFFLREKKDNLKILQIIKFLHVKKKRLQEWYRIFFIPKKLVGHSINEIPKFCYFFHEEEKKNTRFFSPYFFWFLWFFFAPVKCSYIIHSIDLKYVFFLVARIKKNTAFSFIQSILSQNL